MNSNITYRSNIYPVNNSPSTDSKFLSMIHDPFALRELKRRKMDMTPTQTREYDRVSIPCTYADNGDWPWGTRRDANGTIGTACKCLKHSCRLFNECRPDFDSAELEVLHDNDHEAYTAFVRVLETPTANIPRITDNTSSLHTDTVSELEEETKQTAKVDKASVDQKHTTPTQTIQTIAPSNDELKAIIDRILAAQTSISTLTPTQTPTPISHTTSPHRLNTAAATIREAFISAEQTDIINASIHDRIVVNGGPGTGKTYTLIERLKYLVSDDTVDPERIVVLCYSRSAVEVIRTRLNDAIDNGEASYGLKSVDVRTFDSFATYLISQITGTQVTGNYDARIREATSIILRHPDALEACSHMIVDEVQDLVGCRAEFVLALLKALPGACGFTICGDSCQSLYDYQYQNDKSIMPSEKFYEKLYEAFIGASYLEICGNRRQSNDRAQTLAPYRDAILSHDVAQAEAAMANVVNNIPKANIRMQTFSMNDAKQYLDHGSLGILTRTNAQALRISSWLRANGVHHNLLRGHNDQHLGDWIAKIFYDYNNATIDETDFIKRHTELFPSIDIGIANARWIAMVNAQRTPINGPRYAISHLLREVMNNAKDPLLFQSNDEEESSITVSNIHRAKGKEFDSVLVLDDVFQDQQYFGSSDPMLEHKTRYVALTRFKHDVQRIEMSTEFTYIMKNSERRCFRSNKRGKYITHFESGLTNDIDEIGFAMENTFQNTLRERAQVNMQLKLIKGPEMMMPNLRYAIVTDDEYFSLLGITSATFTDELEEALKRILKLSYGKAVYYPVYPHAFCDVYIDKITTVIADATHGLNGAKVFGDVAIWNGLAISGYAQVDRDTY